MKKMCKLNSNQIKRRKVEKKETKYEPAIIRISNFTKLESNITMSVFSVLSRKKSIINDSFISKTI